MGKWVLLHKLGCLAMRLLCISSTVLVCSAPRQGATMFTGCYFLALADLVHVCIHVLGGGLF